MFAKLFLFFNSNVGQELYKIARDAVEAGITAVFVLNLSIPGDLNQAKAEALTVGTIFFAAFVAVVRRELIPWVLGKVS
jgi:hypothetical protein